MNTLAVRIALVAVAGLSLGACSSYGNDGHGYSRVAVGIRSGYYSDPYYGWYDGYYYPGSGYYVWDHQGYRHRWSGSHQRYWKSRRGDRRAHSDWSGYNHRRLGDYRAAPQQRYREQRTDPRRYHEQRPTAVQRYWGQRPVAASPTKQRAERSRPSARSSVENSGRRDRQDRRGDDRKRHKKDD